MTQILSAIEQGDAGAIDQLLPNVYAELRAIAQNQMKNERSDVTLQPTALVHEAYLRLVGGAGLAASGRRYFFAAAAEAMRRILIDRARARGAIKRGGEGSHRSAVDGTGTPVRRIRLDSIQLAGDEVSTELLDLDDALARFTSEDPQKAELVKLRFFAGLSLEEAASLLGISAATADRHWRYARAWLYRKLSHE